VNAIVSCVRGPSARREWAGAPREAIYSVGPILEGLGLNLTFWSYLDQFFVGILACPDRVTGLGEIRAGLHDELQMLTAAVAAREER
jgi:diacylglycerol O-acyltransferase